MQKEFGPKGLVVVGVTNEPESLVTKAVDGNRMKFPVAMTKGEDFERAYGVKGFPSSYLVDADGFVAWQGHPGNFDDDQLKELLEVVWVPPALPEKHAALLAKDAVVKIENAYVKAFRGTPNLNFGENATVTPLAATTLPPSRPQTGIATRRKRWPG